MPTAASRSPCAGSRQQSSAAGNSAAVIDVAGECGAPAIIGSMQGRAAGAVGRDAALDHLAAALAALGERAARHVDDRRDELLRPAPLRGIGMTQLQAMPHPAGPGADGGQPQPVCGEQAAELGRRKLRGAPRKDLHGVEAELGGHPAGGREAAGDRRGVEHERPFAGLGHETDGERGAKHDAIVQPVWAGPVPPRNSGRRCRS